MSRFLQSIQSYLLYASPFVIGCAVWSSYREVSKEAIDESLLTSWLWEVLSWNLILWFIALIAFLVYLVVVPEAREKTLKRLANIKDQDEREEYITGLASRSSYISSISILILFLFFSVFTVSVHSLTESERVDGKTKSLSIDLNFDIWEPKPKNNDDGHEILFTSTSFGLSKSAIIFVLLAWQILSFNLVARRELTGNSA